MKSFVPVLFLSLCFLMAGCGTPSTPVRPAPISTSPTTPGSTPQDQAASAWTLSSTDFGQGAAIPAKYTCTGDNISPALAWTDAPAGTKSLALIMDDPDAPGGTWVHWVLYNLPPETRGLPEGASKARAPPNSAPPRQHPGPDQLRPPGLRRPLPALRAAPLLLPPVCRGYAFRQPALR